MSDKDECDDDDESLLVLTTHGAELAARTEWGFHADVRRRASMGFVVRMTPHAGHGVFATRSFRAGDVLLEEPPLLNWPAGVQMTRHNVGAGMEWLLKETSASARAQMSSLVAAPAKHGELYVASDQA